MLNELVYSEEAKDAEMVLGEDAAAELDQCLRQLSIGDRISVTCYLNDTYAEAIGTVCRIDLIGDDRPEPKIYRCGGVLWFAF